MKTGSDVSRAFLNINVRPRFDVFIRDTPIVQQAEVQPIKGYLTIFFMEVGRSYLRELIVVLANTGNAILRRVAFESGRSRLACFPHASVFSGILNQLSLLEPNPEF
jgi:hypothetical protein